MDTNLFCTYNTTFKALALPSSLGDRLYLVSASRQPLVVSSNYVLSFVTFPIYHYLKQV